MGGKSHGFRQPANKGIVPSQVDGHYGTPSDWTGPSANLSQSAMRKILGSIVDRGGSRAVHALVTGGGSEPGSSFVTCRYWARTIQVAPREGLIWSAREAGAV
ncbi:uncharacterized protein PG986_003859 [Apiospora aurea]|uniref:Uncharacterized protein n=1 Tax=Apiospora aurea TaxID=335848 RepID=A0ABR1QLQ6_9PEZI